ncbi:IclR family transcriptional regulator [Anaerospora hongkongensis]|uniref:IclR family transcriptional regulator n=1 Tax=Anaerospora hongkongensis TaxID=244830 RepID=UPI0028A1261C|nr:IclR family transcriptional regulator C-terminal domain-containing protein [Anaerospora hongkongensis]
MGVKLLQLGELFAQRLDIRTVAKPILTQLADETGKVALLAVLSKQELIIIDKVEPERPFLIIPKFDFSLAFHSTAVGKVLLAFAAEEIRDAILEKELAPFTPFTITDVDEVKTELNKVYLDAYAIGCDETIEGVTCFAVPIYNAANQVVAALSVSSASSLVNFNGYDPILAVLKQKAAIISQRLGQQS